MKKNKNNNKNKKKRAPDPPGYLRPNSFVPRAPKGTHAEEGSLASEKVPLPMCTSNRRASFLGWSSYPVHNSLYGQAMTTHITSGLMFIHEFLRLCRKRSPDKTKHLIDVLVTQHAKWIASRLRRPFLANQRLRQSHPNDQHS